MISPKAANIITTSSNTVTRRTYTCMGHLLVTSRTAADAGSLAKANGQVGAITGSGEQLEDRDWCAVQVGTSWLTSGLRRSERWTACRDRRVGMCARTAGRDKGLAYGVFPNSRGPVSARRRRRVASVSPRQRRQIDRRLIGRHPAHELDAARAGDGDEVASGGRFGGIAVEWAVRAVQANELFDVAR